MRLNVDAVVCKLKKLKYDNIDTSAWRRRRQCGPFLHMISYGERRRRAVPPQTTENV